MSSQNSPHTAGLACWLSDFPLLLDHKHLEAGFTLNLPPAVSAQPSTHHLARPAWAEQFQALAMQDETEPSWAPAGYTSGPGRGPGSRVGCGNSGRGERAFTHQAGFADISLKTNTQRMSSPCWAMEERTGRIWGPASAWGENFQDPGLLQCFQNESFPHIHLGWVRGPDPTQEMPLFHPWAPAPLHFSVHRPQKSHQPY